MWHETHWVTARQWLQTNPPRLAAGGDHYALCPSGIVVLHRGVATVCPGVHTVALYDAICRAVEAAAPAKLERQRGLGQEVAGLILCGHDGSLADIEVQDCEGVGGNAQSSDPHCGGRRRCKVKKSVVRGMGIKERCLGEWHTHPPPLPTVLLPAPPSCADLYQAALAHVKGEHGLSVIIASEGLYLIGTSHTVSSAHAGELERFYRDHNVKETEQQRAISTCRQPLLKYIKPTRTPMLHRIFTHPQRCYDDLMHALAEQIQTEPRSDERDEQSDFGGRRVANRGEWGQQQQEAVDKYCESVQEHVGQRIRFYPFARRW